MQSFLSAPMASASSTAASCVPFMASGGSSSARAIIQLCLALNATRRIQARQQWMDAGLFQRPDGAWWNVARYYFHSEESTFFVGEGLIWFITLRRIPLEGTVGV